MTRKLHPEQIQTIAFKKSLADDGWRTPDTYGREFEPVPDGPGVYLFLLYLDEFFDRAQVAYVGMSIDVKRRWANHEVLRLIQPRGYTQRWFKPERPVDLRLSEATYIAKFNPPWNIIGRPRGVIQ